MKKLFSPQNNSKSNPRPTAEQIAAAQILFVTPTISHDTALLEPLRGMPGRRDFTLHEDDWSQIEFFPSSQLETIRQVLREYKQFEVNHREQNGWSKVYVRRIERVPILTSALPIALLEEILGFKADDPPILYSSGSYGRVINGFSIPLGGKITIYGYTEGQSIPILGAYMGKDPIDSILIDAFVKLNMRLNLFMVNWRAQFLLCKADHASQVDKWCP